QETFLESLRTALESAPKDVSVVDAAFAVFREYVSDDLAVHTMARAQITVVAGARNDTAGTWTQYNLWAEVIGDFVRQRTRTTSDAFAAEVVGCAIWSAIWTA